MAESAKCPACREKVAVPEGFPESASVRCPLCQAEFSLGEALAAARQAPPVLIPIGASAEGAPSEAPVETERIDAQPEEPEATPAGPTEEAPEAVHEVSDSREPTEVAAEDADALRAKAEVFRDEAENAADQLDACQAQADALQHEAEGLIAKAGALASEAEEAHARAQALAAKADRFKHETAAALETLADALEAVASAYEQQSDALTAQLAEPTPAAESPQAEASQDSSADEGSEGSKGQADPFAFLREAALGVEDVQPETSQPAPGPETPPEESKPAEEKEDMFAFLRAVEGEEKQDGSAEETEPGSPAEQPESAAEEEPVEPATDQKAVEAEPAAEQLEASTTEPEACMEEATTAQVETPSVDAEALRARIETLRAAAQSLRARAAELRAQADLLRGARREEGPDTEAGPQGAWAGVWQPVSAAPAIDLGAAAGAMPAPGRAVRPVRKRKEKSLLGELVGIVLGGIAGLTIAYYGLNFFGGIRYDFAKIYLPGIKHTVKHRPAWWPEWARFEGEPEQPSEPAAEEDSFDLSLPPPAPSRRPKGSRPPKVDSAAEVPAVRKPTLPKPARPQPQPREQPKNAPAKNIAHTGGSSGPYVELAHRPTYKADELGRALKAAHAAFGCPKCASTGRVGQTVCPDCQGHPPAAMTPSVYPEFCRLGEVLAFVDAEAGTGQLDARKAAARDLLFKVGARRENVVEVANLALSLLDDPHRKAPGVMIAGVVQETESKGQLHRATIKLASSERTMKVISKEPLGLAKDDRVLVLGCLVRNSNAGGSSSAVPMFIWSGLVAKFGK